MKKLSYILVFLIYCAPLHAQLWSGVLDPTRATTAWTTAGAGSTLSANYVQVGSTIAAYNGNTNTINTALALCDGTTGQYVLLGAGTFNLTGGGTNNGVNIARSKCVLRGSGPTQTKLVTALGTTASCQGENTFICLNGAAINVPEINIANVTAGATQGSTSITVGANTSGSTKIVVGQTVRIQRGVDGTIRSADTGSIFVCLANPVCTQAGGQGDGGDGFPELQFVVVTTISAGSCPCTVTFTPGLYMPNLTSGNVTASWNSTNPFTTGQGVENLSIDDSANAAASGGDIASIGSIGASYGWIKNIISIKIHSEPVTLANTQRHVRIFESHHMTVRDSYFVGRAGKDDYGVNFYLSGDSLVENNIFQHMPSEMMNEQGSGKVFSYNFCVDQIWNDASTQFAQGSIYGHGGQDHYLLSEGNICFSQEFENYFGQGFFNTNFRNRYPGEEPGLLFQTVPGFVYGLNRYFNYVANVLGVSGYHGTYASYGGGSATTCNTSIWAVGFGDNCNNGDGTTHPKDDVAANDGGQTSTAQTTLLRWGNYDVVNASVQWNTAEVPSGLSLYSNAVPTACTSIQTTCPASFYLNAKPSFWPNGKAWPNIGPEISTGNVGVCSGGTFAGWPAVSTAAFPSPCTGGSLASAGIGLHVISNPAMDCYFSLGGPPDGGGRTATAIPLTTFDANTCYPAIKPSNSVNGTIMTSGSVLTN